MKTRLLGRSGLRVSELCLGVSNFCSTGLYRKSGEIGQQEADLIVATALDRGINFFNVAEIYSDGNAEPDEIARLASQAGLDYAIITDHNAYQHPP